MTGRCKLLDLAHDVLSSDDLPLDGGAFQVVTLAPWQLWRASKSREFADCVRAADATTIDGNWLGVFLSLARRPHSVVTGRGIVQRYYDDPAYAARVAIVGSSDDALAAVRSSRPGWVTFGGEFGANVEGGALSAIVAEIRAKGIRLVFVALGSPKQEIWGRQIADGAHVCVVGIGGSVETAVGLREMPSLAAQQLRMEWLQRTVQDPLRFLPRLAQALTIFPILFVEAITMRSKLARSTGKSPVPND